MLLRQGKIGIFILANEKYLRNSCGLIGHLGVCAINKKGECY
jgi:hypothetical protein